MRRLMLLRHAKTETHSPSGRDQDRRLDDRGLADARIMGEWLARHPPGPDLVQVSPAARTRQTWELVRDSMQQAMAGKFAAPDVALPAELYGADPAQILQIIRGASKADPKRLLVIGHNPGMYELALMLTGDGGKADRAALAGNLPTSGLVILDFAVDDWNEVSFRGGHLAAFVSPKLLKQASGK